MTLHETLRLADEIVGWFGYIGVALLAALEVGRASDRFMGRRRERAERKRLIAEFEAKIKDPAEWGRLRVIPTAPTDSRV